MLFIGWSFFLKNWIINKNLTPFYALETKIRNQSPSHPGNFYPKVGAPSPRFTLNKSEWGASKVKLLSHSNGGPLTFLKGYTKSWNFFEVPLTTHFLHYLTYIWQFIPFLLAHFRKQLIFAQCSLKYAGKQIFYVKLLFINKWRSNNV